MIKKYLAEAVGTFILVFCGTGAIIVNELNGGVVTHIGIAITFGLTVLAMIYALGDISGAHINPAVTIAFAVAKRLKWHHVLPYIFAQIAGALLASFSLKLMFPASQLLGTTLPSGSVLQSFVMEAIITFILMYVILNTSSGAKEKGITAGIAVASVVTLTALFAGPICGASLNPARSLAPALVSGHLEFLWIYMVAPLFGAIVAVMANIFIRE